MQKCVKLLSGTDNIFVNLARDKMGPEEIRDFNKKIDGRIVYLIDD